MLRSLVLLLALLVPIICDCRVSATTNGLWSLASTWGGTIPSASRAVDITTSKTVTLNGVATAALMNVKVRRTLYIVLKKF